MTIPFGGWANAKTHEVGALLSSSVAVYEIIRPCRDWASAKAALVAAGITTTIAGTSLDDPDLDIAALDEHIREA